MFKIRSTTSFMGNSETTSAPRYRSAAFSETARQSRHGSQSRDQIFCPKKKPTGDNRRALATLP
jgi:hypothetical protein